MEANDTVKGRMAPWTLAWSIASFFCLGAVLPWLGWCYYGLCRANGLGGVVWIVIAAYGSVISTLIGAACGGIALLRGRSRGLAVGALALNLLVLVMVAVLVIWDWYQR